MLYCSTHLSGVRSRETVTMSAFIKVEIQLKMLQVVFFVIYLGNTAVLTSRVMGPTAK